MDDIKDKGLTLSDDDLYVLVNASSSGNLNPKEAVKCLYELENAEYSENFNLLRTDLYTIEDDAFISLGAKR